MAQPATYTCTSAFKAEISTDGTSWTDISGEAVAIELEGGEQMVGEQMTAEGAFALICASGKTEPYGLTIRSVYSEDATGAFALAWARFAGATKTLYARWSPRGGAQGTSSFVTSADGEDAAAVPIVSCTPPALDASEAKPALFELTLRTPALSMETVA